MSRPTRWSVVCAVFVACAATVIACATGGSSNRNGGGDDVVDPIDAPVTTQKDANEPPPSDAPMADAPKMIDGSVVVQDAAVMPDAPPPLFCSANSDCTAPGTCCFLSLCVNGTVILSQCFPGN
jgi:hypothetical protein